MGLAQLKALEDPTPALHVLPTPAPVATPTAAPVKKAGGLSLGALGKAKPAKAKGEERPTLDADAELQALATQYADIQPRYKALEGAVEIARKEIIARAFPLWLKIASGKPDLSSVQILGTAPTDKLLFSIQNRYPAAVDFEAGQHAILEAIARPDETPNETLARFDASFEMGLTVQLKFAKVPEDKRQALIDDLLPIFEKHELLTVPEGADADSEDGEVSPAVVCKQILQPKPGFHVSRHTLFSYEENYQLQQIMPAVGMVKVTGLKK